MQDNQPLVIDLSQVDLTVLPAGEYVVQLTDFTVGMSQQAQPKATLVWTILEGERKGRKINDMFSLQPQAVFRFAQRMCQLGIWTPETLPQSINVAEIREAILGATVVAATQPRQGPDGNVYPNILGLKPYGEVGVDANEIDAAGKGLLAAAQAALFDDEDEDK